MAYELAEQLLWRAQGRHDPALLLYAQMALGQASYRMGQLLRAREHLEHALSLYDRERPRPLAVRYLTADIGVTCLSYTANTLWHLGYPDQALKRSDEAVALAQTLSQPFSFAFAEVCLGVVYQSRRETRAAQKIAESATSLFVEYGLTLFLAYATGLHGWAMAKQGGYEAGIALMQESLAAQRATGAELWRPYFLCLLAEACMETGRLDDGLSALTEALAAADKHGDQNQAEIHRLKGELLLRQGDSNTVEAQNCFQRAIDIARKQSAKSWELRATTSLARLLDKQGRRDEARAMLAEIYGWFTEGFDTADLKDAKALLDELGA